MYHKDGRYRIHQRERIIRKRQQIIRDCWVVGDDEELIYFRQPNRLSKYNLNCTCPMCSRERYSRADRVFDWRSAA